jgi:hypothetical protein
MKAANELFPRTSTSLNSIRLDWVVLFWLLGPQRLGDQLQPFPDLKYTNELFNSHYIPYA